MDYRVKKALPIVLAMISSMGTIATAILVAKETPKAIKKLEEFKKSKEKETVTFIEKIKIFGPVYAPAIAVCAATVASTVSATIISRKIEASLTASAVMLSQGWTRYKSKINDVLGKKFGMSIDNSISDDAYKKKEQEGSLPETKDGVILFYEEHLGWFTTTKEDLVSALSDANQRLYAPDPDVLGTFYWATLATIIADAGARVLDPEKLKASKNIGWTDEYLSETFGSTNIWIHPQYTNVIDKETGKQKYIRLSFWEDPIFLNPDALQLKRLGGSESNATLKHDSEVPEEYIEEVEKEYEENTHQYSSMDNVSDDKLDYFRTCSTKDKSNSQLRYTDGTDPDDPDDINKESLPDPMTIPALDKE